MKYKAIFFDRDNTLTYFTKEKELWRDRTISEWSGKPLDLPYEKMMKLFKLAAEGREPWYTNLDDEREFFKRYYKHLLIGEGVKEDIDARAELLFNELWCNGDRALFPETIEVLEYFSSRGYKMGVISDTSPSLEYTLQQLGIAKYFTSFTASSLVGASKPSPIIFNAALNAQGVTAQESIYVDDYKPEADGAREQGFTTFLIDRSGKNTDKWTIHNLKELINFAENANNKSTLSESVQDNYFQYIDGIPFKLKKPFNFDFIGKYGRVFKVFDDQDSGNICFGTEKNGQKYFVKFAGAPTKEYNGSAEEAIDRLKSTLPIYENLKHKNLIELVCAEEIGGGFAMVFKWAEGDCAGRQYPEAHRKFTALPNEVKLRVFSDVLDFLAHVNSQGYVAIDFYDGSILYDHESGKTTICDIDFFKKQPYTNDMGRMWGSAKFMSPEEFERGAAIDEITNVYTAGAFAFALFGRYERDFEKWSLSKALYDVAAKAVSDNRSKRQQSIKQFIKEWETAFIY